MTTGEKNKFLASNGSGNPISRGLPEMEQSAAKNVAGIDQNEDQDEDSYDDDQGAFEDKDQDDYEF